MQVDGGRQPGTTGGGVGRPDAPDRRGRGEAVNVVDLAGIKGRFMLLLLLMLLPLLLLLLLKAFISPHHNHFCRIREHAPVRLASSRWRETPVAARSLRRTPRLVRRLLVMVVVVVVVVVVRRRRRARVVLTTSGFIWKEGKDILEDTNRIN